MVQNGSKMEAVMVILGIVYSILLNISKYYDWVYHTNGESGDKPLDFNGFLLIPIQLQELEEMESRNSQLKKELEQLEESLRLQAVPQTK